MFRKVFLEAGPRQNCDERLGLLVATYLLSQWPAFLTGSVSLAQAPGLVAPDAQISLWSGVTGPFLSWLLLWIYLAFFWSELACCVYLPIWNEQGPDHWIHMKVLIEDVNLMWFPCHCGHLQFYKGILPKLFSVMGKMYISQPARPGVEFRPYIY